MCAEGRGPCGNFLSHLSSSPICGCRREPRWVWKLKLFFQEPSAWTLGALTWVHAITWVVATQSRALAS